jgi:hypothetical protein
MPRPPIPSRKLRPQLPRAAYRWLLAGTRSSWTYLTLRDEDAKREFWRAHEDAVVLHHIKRFPGSRPKMWWRLSAPEPRRRVDLYGIGSPLHECSAVALNYEFGVPMHWRTARNDRYFREGVPISAERPPMFESEANYLRRLGLLLPGERSRLTKRSYEPDALVLRADKYQLLRHDRFQQERVAEFERIGPLRAILDACAER